MSKIGVGIIGITPGVSWSSVAIAPAVRALPEYELVAVSTRRLESARAAAKDLNISAAFDNHQELVSHPEVDLVVVSVKVPGHLELVTAALEAGKNIYCEWPLANGLEEGEQLLALARQKGVRAFVGLQLRSAPFVQYIRDLIDEGYVGRVLSTSLSTAGLLCGPEVPEQYGYTVDAGNGANMLTINFGHVMDMLLDTLKQDVRSLNATTATQNKSVRVIETGAMIPMTAEDQVAVTGTLTNDAVFSTHLWGGPAREGDSTFMWRIHGTDGDLTVTAPGVAIQVTGVTIHGAHKNDPMEVLQVPAKYGSIPNAEGPAQYVALAFSRMADDIRDGTTTCPTFDDAVAQLRIIEAVREANRTGERQFLAERSA